MHDDGIWWQAWQETVLFCCKINNHHENSSNANTRQCCCVSKNGIHKIEDETVEFHFDEQTKKYKCKLMGPDESDDDNVIIKAEALSLPHMPPCISLLGKEDFDGQWCYFQPQLCSSIMSFC